MYDRTLENKRRRGSCTCTLDIGHFICTLQEKKKKEEEERKKIKKKIKKAGPSLGDTEYIRLDMLHGGILHVYCACLVI